MFDEIKKELFSLKLLTLLVTAAVIIYLLLFVFEFLREFSDIIWVFILGWLVSFILEPFVDLSTKYLKLPRLFATALVFIMLATLIILAFVAFVPNIIAQFTSLEKIIPEFLENSLPLIQRIFENFINSLNNSSDLIPSITQFFMNLVIILILSLSILAGVLTAVPVIEPIIGVFLPLLVALTNKRPLLQSSANREIIEVNAGGI